MTNHEKKKEEETNKTVYQRRNIACTADVSNPFSLGWAGKRTWNGCAESGQNEHYLFIARLMNHVSEYL